MNDELLIHNKTRMQLQAFVRSKPHAILITGAVGSGKKTLAIYLANQLLHVKTTENHPYFLDVVPEKQNISIEEIRHVRAFLSRKSTGDTSIRRVVLISNAHIMTNEAQNALLKSLEEPPEDTVIILTATNINQIKATIASRSQHMSVLAVDALNAVKYFNNAGHSELQVMSSYYMSGGRAGLLTALLQQKNDHEMVAAIRDAKQLLRMTPYERLLQVDNLGKQKNQTELLLHGLQRVVGSGLQQAALKDNTAQVNKFHDLSVRLLAANDALGQSANAKLVMSNLFLQM